MLLTIYLLTAMDIELTSSKGHGTLDAIYASVAESCKHRGWDGVDVLIIGGDFQVFWISILTPVLSRQMLTTHYSPSGMLQI